jgi:37-kD nucleoid-associated bacterial protein
MIKPEQLTLHDLIIHKVDHLNFKEARLSDLNSPISEAVDIYLRSQIVLNREHEFARNGVFVPPAAEKTEPPADDKTKAPAKPPPADMKKLCDDLLKDESQFVPRSRDIADHLFASINNDGRIHPGDLVLCTFSEKDKGRWLALLKMDPQDSFTAVEDNVDGKRRLILEQVREVMPIGELQKCAFILPEARRKKRDLVVLDQQQGGYGTRRMVASFFSKSFLQCQVGLNEREMTETFITTSYNWLDSKKSTWKEKDRRGFKNALKAALQERTVKVASFAEDQIEDPVEKEDYIEKLKAESLDLTFKPDKDTAEKPPIIQYVGDKNLRVRINRDEIGPRKMLQAKKDKATQLWTITIKTAKWQKVGE